MGELHGIARVTFANGDVNEFKRLSAQCMEIARTKDSGTLQYEIFFNNGETEAVVYERYRDSEALKEHTANQGELGKAILATGSFSGELLGDPSPELKASLADGPVQVFTPFMSL